MGNEELIADPNYLNVLSIVIGSLIFGWVLQKWLIGFLLKLTRKTKWRWDDIVIESLGNAPLYLTLCLGAYGILITQPFSDEYSGLGQKILISVTIFLVVLLAARLVASMIQEIANTATSRLPSTTLFINGFRLLIYLLGGVLILQNLKIEITPLITALGLGGLAVALALEETLNNLFSGVQIIVSQVVRPGDYVKLDSGYEGYVTDVKARSTTIRSFPDNNRIIVPNRVMASSTLVNYSLPEKNLWIEVSVGVSYESDLKQVERVTLDVAKQVISSVEGGVDEHEPVLCYEEFADSSINFRLRMFVREFKDQFLIKHEFIKELHDRYRKEGIEIPFPIRTVHLKKE